MSSNTLRGVGQDGDGTDGTGDREGQKAPGTGAGVQSDGGTAADTGAANGTDRMPELRNIRSLDSTVPGTRSLDSSVPDAQPSLDGRVPSLAATMLGMTAPSIPKRDAAARPGGREPAGTVQGRDVHLPVELQRRAGVIAVPGSSLPTPDGAPEAVDRSEPTIADPVRVPHGGRDNISHGPWYEQQPAGADAYEEARPNLIGRVAIGAAIAASLSVVLFAIVRVRAQNAAQEAEALAVPPPVLQEGPSARPAAETPPAAATPSPPPYPAGLPPEPGAAPGGAGPSAEAEGSPSPTSEKTSAPARSAGAMTAPNRSRPTARPGAGASSGLGASASKVEPPPLPANLFRPKALGDSEPPAPTTPPSPEPSGGPAPTTPPPAASTAPPPAEPAPGQPSAGRPGTAGEVPGPGARTRAKKTDDPDSTLPLNLD